MLIVAALAIAPKTFAQREIQPTNEIRVIGDLKSSRTFTIDNIKKYKQN